MFSCTRVGICHGKIGEFVLTFFSLLDSGKCGE